MLLIIDSKGYLVDSSTLLNWRRRITGTDPKQARFRKWIRAAFQIGLLNISRAIEEEIERNSPTLSKLLKKWGVKPIDSDSDKALKGEADAMLAQLEAEGRITSDKCVGVNDLRIILTAERYELAVVTDEAHGKVRCNMPTVCRERGVPCARPCGPACRTRFVTAGPRPCASADPSPPAVQRPEKPQHLGACWGSK